MVCPSVCVCVCLSTLTLDLQATRRFTSGTNGISATRVRKIMWRILLKRPLLRARNWHCRGQLRGPTHQLTVRMRIEYTLFLCACARLVLLQELSLQSRVAVISVRYIQVPVACFRAVVSVVSTYCVAHVDGSSLPRLCSRIIVHRTHVCAEGFAL